MPRQHASGHKFVSAFANLAKDKLTLVRKNAFHVIGNPSYIVPMKSRWPFTGKNQKCTLEPTLEAMNGKGVQ